APCARRKLNFLPRISFRSYPVRERKLSFAKMIGLWGSVASVNTIAIRVSSAATTNGPRFFRKLSTSASAPFCSSDFFVIFDMPQVDHLFGGQGGDAGARTSATPNAAHA